MTMDAQQLLDHLTEGPEPVTEVKTQVTEVKTQVTTTPIIIALNKAWQAIQRNHQELGNVMIVTGRRRHKGEARRRGEQCKGVWHAHEHDDRLSEIVIYGERLAEGAEAVMQTLLHEAAHELAVIRKLTDTSNKNRYHNKTFVKLAEELGLKGPEKSGGPSMGYSDCTIIQETTETYNYEIKELAEACKNYVAPSLEDITTKVKKETLYAYCECEDEEARITWTKKLEKRYDDTGFFPLMCSACRQVFVPEGEDRPKDGSNQL